VVLAGAAFAPLLVSKAWHEFRHPAPPPAGSNPTQRLTTLSGTRYNLWDVALHAFTAHPLTGTGAGTYSLWWNRHARDSESVQNAHSIWFETMAELGAPGLLLILVFFVGAIVVVILVRRLANRRTSAAASTAAAAALIVFVLHASVDWMWQSTAITILALAGVMAAGSRLSAGKLSFGWLPRGVLVLLAVLSAMVQIPGLVSTLEVRRSQSAERHGNGALALAWARAAVSAESWAASPYDQEGLVLESAGRLSRAATELRRAARNEPLNFVHWLLLSRVETEQGRLAQASRDYAHARSLSPKGAVFSSPGGGG
jgi:cytochrome c-type biogenesis protein CcmH/NrfG